jgi:hypothetical protein
MMNAENRFIDAARKHGLATREGDPSVANRAHDDLVTALQELRRTPDRGVAFLSDQLSNADASVVTWAALYLLPSKEKEASEALQRVAAQGLPRVSFGADMTLQEWRAGRLEVE